MTEPDEAAFTAGLTADIVADVEHPDPAELSADERRHLGLPDDDDASSEEQAK